MRYSKLYQIIIFSLLSLLNTAQAQNLRSFNPDDGIFYLKSGDGHEEYDVSGALTFKCVKDGNSFPSYRDAGVTFSPENAGEIIQISIDEIDLDGTTNYLLLYQGYVKTGYNGASNGVGQSSYMPAGWFEKAGVSSVGNVYTSTSDDGKLTIGFHSGSAYNIKGFKITVTSLSPKDMEFVSAGAFLDNNTSYRGARNQVLSGANIKMDGSGNPPALDELIFDTSLLSSSQVENIRIYNNDKFIDANLLTTATQTKAAIGINSSVLLRNGDNKFYLVADIKPDASGTIPAVSIRSIKINNEQKIINPVSQNPISVNNDILIGKQHLIYTISENAGFYDDGGKEGKISSNFEGTITFLPAASGKKIKIDFSKLEIFNTSSVGNNDVFKFYDGQVVDESNLIATLLKEPKIIKSTADDGSLTVYLKSTTGVPANGWEAIVSEFTPGPMTFDGFDVTSLSSETVSGSNKDEQFLLLNLKATNTLNPLTLQKIYIDATGTTNILNLDKAKVYSLGEKNDFKTSGLFGEVSVSGTNIEINGIQDLKEGNNYFVVGYDLTSAASNGDLISAAVNKLVISGEEKNGQAATSTRTVKNIFKSQKGNHVREFHDTWIYTDTKSSINPSYYEFEDADCYITFKPSVAETVAEIEFSSFDVYYSSSSYGTKAVFEVYSGTSLTQENLLWKLDSYEQSTTGPEKKLRSLAADGSITIKFNAKTTTSYYAGKGWTATVTPFVNQNMMVEKVEAFQTNTTNLKPASINQEIIGMSIKTEGNLSNQVLKEVKINLKGSDSVIDKVSVLYSAGQKEFSQAVLFGSQTNLSTQEITITGEQTLQEGISYFWVAYDIKNTIPPDVQVDAKLISVKTDENLYLPENGDPDGYRLTKNEYILSSGNNGTVTIHNPIMFYDDGGAENEYSLNFDGKITFLPSGADKVIKLTFNSFRTYSSHYFYLYNGTEVNEDNLIGKYSSTTFPESLFSKADNGAITVRFVSTSSGMTYAGWEIGIESYTPQDLFINKITTSAVTNSDILRGSIKAPVQKIEIEVGGDKGLVYLNNFKFNNIGTTQVSDILSANLYYTNTSSGFIADNQAGNEATTAPYGFSLSEDIRITEPGTYYFWLTYDIDLNANTGNKVTASMTEVSVGGTPYSSIVEPAVAERHIKAGFKGTYTIGKSGNANYTTFGDAVSAMQDGVEGAVRFNVEAGTYPENIKIQAIQGTSEKHDILFTSVSGKNDDVIITGSGYSDPPYGQQKYGMAAIDSTNYVTFENMSFIPSVQTYPSAVHVLHVSRYFTLRNCIIQATPVTSGYTGMNLLHMEARNVEGNNNDYITVENNTLTGGYIALYMGGTGYIALTKERGAVIRNNNISNAGSKGIYLTDEQDALIENNTVISSTTQKTGYIGIDIFRNKSKLIIRNNKIINHQAYYSTGINLRQEVEGSENAPVLVYNNSVGITAAPNNSSYGFDITSDCAYIALYHNTVNMSGNGGYALGITKTYETVKSILLQNNLLQNNTPSPVFYINKLSQLNALSFKNNAYYTTGSTFASTGGNDFEAWQATTNDTQSFVEEAEFVTPSDLHLKTQGGFNAALPVDFILTDADGKTRNLSTPTIGAYEYEAIVAVKPEIEQGYPKTGIITYNSIEVKTKWNQTGNLYTIIKKISEQAPTEEELLASNAHPLTSGEESLITFTGLEEETDYKVYFVFVSILDIHSDFVDTDTIRTIKRIFPFSVTLPETWTTIQAGEQTSLYPVVSGGVYPYIYEWKNQMNETISTDSILTVTPDVVQQYKLTVTGSDNQNRILYSDVLVKGENKIATFEDNYLAPESFWQGRDDKEESVFYSGSYRFTNTYYPKISTWGGFAYSNVTETTFVPSQFLTHQFRSVVGKGTENSDTYAVLYTLGVETQVDVINTDEGFIIPGVYLTNNAYTLNSILNGDYHAGTPFKKGDFFKVVFTGTTKSGSITSVEHYLADYRSDNESEHYVLTDWEWFDLSELGTITTFDIEATSSRNGTPAYICLDNLGALNPSIIGLNPEKVENVSVYPVPARDVLNVSTSYDNYSIRIYNMQGQMVMIQNKASGKLSLDITNLLTGNYILEIISDQGKQMKNFIKQ